MQAFESKTSNNVMKLYNYPNFKEHIHLLHVSPLHLLWNY